MNDNRTLRVALLQQLQSLHLSGVQQVEFEPTAAPYPDAKEAIQQVTNHSEVSPTKPNPCGSPAPSAVAAEKSLHVLSQQVATCTRCAELAERRNQTVFGVGNPTARLCLLGEAPGADEDRLGEPFVGRAGQLLDKILAACTLSREDVYILNVIKCRPPGNRNPLPEEVDHCREYFEQQIALIQPEFICCLGAVAASNLLETKLPIGKLRGRFHDWNGIQVLATYHPAYLLRNPAAKKEVWKDMQMLMAEMGIPLPRK